MDLFWKKGIPVVGPLKELAQIETSKGFTRDLLNKYKIDVSPNYKRFNSLTGVKNFMGITRDKAKQNGFVETVYGRRLYLPEIKSKN